MVTASLHYWYELARKSGSEVFIPDEVAAEWEGYKAWVERMPTPERSRYQQIHEGHCTYLVPEERRFVTPNMIRASGGLVGEPDEILHRLRELERGGLQEVTLLPPMAVARQSFRAFAERVMAKY
jgi:hypothetical protein